MFGGASDCHTWVYQGGAASFQDWQPTSAPCGPATRTGHAMACDELRSSIVMFGGSVGGGETWTLGRLPFMQSVVGYGCGGAMAGLYGPPIDVSWGMFDPWMYSLPGSSVYGLQAGFVVFSGGALPQGVNLSQPLGLPHACVLHVAPDVVEIATAQAPGDFRLTLPGIPYGVTNLFIQGLMVGVGSYPGAFYLSATPAFRIL